MFTLPLWFMSRSQSKIVLFIKCCRAHITSCCFGRKKRKGEHIFSLFFIVILLVFLYFLDLTHFFFKFLIGLFLPLLLDLQLLLLFEDLKGDWFNEWDRYLKRTLPATMYVIWMPWTFSHSITGWKLIRKKFTIDGGIDGRQQEGVFYVDVQLYGGKELMAVIFSFG